MLLATKKMYIVIKKSIMRLFITILVLLSLCISSWGQDKTYTGLHGLKDDKGNLFFEYRGYNIFVTKAKGHVDEEKTIKKIIKNNNLGTILAQYSVDEFTTKNLLIESESVPSEKPNALVNNACYLFDRDDNYVDILLFQNFGQRDHFLERDLVNAYFSGDLNKYVQIGNAANTISFVGREIVLGDLCKWSYPNNVKCRGGQINWSEFLSIQDAVVDLQAKILANEHPDIKILSDIDVGLLFEGVATTARRIVYLGPHERYPLAVYYVAQEVRGRYVNAILSNYVYNRDDYELSPLLQQIITNLQLPENAWNEFDKPKYEEPHTLKNYWSRYNIYAANLKLGTWIPMDDASRLYSVAPTVAFSIGIPVKRDMAVDMNIYLGFATNRKTFDYYVYDRYILEAKTDMLFGIGLKYRYQKEMARNVYFTPYVGLGLHSLQTNQLKRKADSENENNEYYSIETLDGYGGVDVRFKRIGAFFEYHYTPYHWNKHAKNNMGNSAINMGLYFVLW